MSDNETNKRNEFAQAAQEGFNATCDNDCRECWDRSCYQRKELNSDRSLYREWGMVFCNLSHPDECQCIGVWEEG